MPDIAPEELDPKIIAISLDGALAIRDKVSPIYDRPARWCIRLIDCFSERPGIRVVILCERAQDQEIEARDWLNNYVEAFFGGFVDLAMIGTSHGAKAAWLKSVGGPEKIMFVVDREPALWTKAGVVCLKPS